MKDGHGIPCDCFKGPTKVLFCNPCLLDLPDILTPDVKIHKGHGSSRRKKDV